MVLGLKFQHHLVLCLKVEHQYGVGFEDSVPRWHWFGMFNTIVLLGYWVKTSMELSGLKVQHYSGASLECATLLWCWVVKSELLWYWVKGSTPQWCWFEMINTTIVLRCWIKAFLVLGLMVQHYNVVSLECSTSLWC